MTESVIESGMEFIVSPEQNLYYIEKSPVYAALQNEMKMAEFVLYDDKKKKVFVVEAKTSAPNPNSNVQAANFNTFINEIDQKLSNAMDLFAKQALCSALPAGFEKIDYSNVNIVFVLVIKNHKKEWLQTVNDALGIAVNKHKRFKKIWKCNVIVLNEDSARKKKLIL